MAHIRAHIRMPIGSRIRRKRKAIGLSQAALAQALGISASYLNLIEANKRAIGGKLLLRIGERLAIDLASLSSENDARIVSALAELMAEPVMAGADVDAATIRDLVVRFPEVAAALARLHRAYADTAADNEALRHRLKSDPFLSQILHEILNRIAGMKAGAEILATIPDLTEVERGRFVASINGEARDLVPTVRRLVDYFEKNSAARKPVSPLNEVDEAILAHSNHFPALEDAAESLRAALEAAGGVNEATLAGRLPAAAGHGGAEPAATRLFGLVRAHAADRAADTIERVADTLLPTSPEARTILKRALSSYLAAAVLMPYERTLSLAEALRYDVEMMAEALGTSFEQVAHRLVTLRRKGREGVPFGFLRADRAGRLSKRYPLPGLALPTSGHGCLLWPLYSAFSTPGITRQISVFPSGARFLQLARTVAKRPAGFRQQPPVFSIMLACDMLHADRTVYGQGIGPDFPTVEVGPSCLLCPRTHCAHRNEAPA